METGEDPNVKRQPWIDTAFRKVMSPERIVEILSAQIMMGLEIMHDTRLYPEKYGLRPDQVGPLPNPNTDPAAAWAVDHIGDIWEISAGHTALRLGFVAVNEALKKTTGKEIPDEACFWASLVTTVTVKAIHSLGYISLFGIHDHMDNPVPEMLFGQGVAAVVLAGSHYAGKYHEPIKDLALRVGTRIAKGVRSFDEKMKAPRSKRNVTPDIAVNLDE